MMRRSTGLVLIGDEPGLARVLRLDAFVRFLLRLLAGPGCLERLVRIAVDLIGSFIAGSGLLLRHGWEGSHASGNGDDR